MQIKATVRYWLTPMKIALTKKRNVGKDIEKLEPLCLAVGD